MSKATIIRTGAPMPDAKTLDAVRAFIFGTIDGFRDPDRKFWRRFWKKVTTMEPGEMCDLEIVFPRNPKFHRKFFALLQVGYDAWEPGRKHKTYKGQPIAKNFDQFREDVLILAGFFEQTFTLNGRMRLKAKSISFAKMDDQQFEAVYSAVADVLLDKVLANYKGRADLDDVVDKIVGFL